MVHFLVRSLLSSWPRIKKYLHMGQGDKHVFTHAQLSVGGQRVRSPCSEWRAPASARKIRSRETTASPSPCPAPPPPGSTPCANLAAARYCTGRSVDRRLNSTVPGNEILYHLLLSTRRIFHLWNMLHVCAECAL